MVLKSVSMMAIDGGSRMDNIIVTVRQAAEQSTDPIRRDMLAGIAASFDQAVQVLISLLIFWILLIILA